MASGRRAQAPSSSSLSWATMRPRSQRVVCSKAGPLGTGRRSSVPAPGAGGRGESTAGRGPARQRPAVRRRPDLALDATGTTSAGAPTADRAVAAGRTSRAAERGAELHRGVGPGGRVISRHELVGRHLQLPRRQDLAGEPADDPADIGVHGSHRLAEGQGRHRARRVRSHPRQLSQLLHAVGHSTVVLVDDDAGGPLQMDRTSVVAQPRPRSQHIRW